ncbi:prepilin peptidase [Sphingomonas sp.]|uniref:prepilin peptidase n=1 Tax=Sphingomonas sp. TaxID=28214 RepID=UPI003AFFE0BD
MAGELLLAGMAGAVAGSFLATVAIRDGRGEPVSRGRSRCDRCAVPVPIWANVPVASWLWLRGRCGACHAAIDPRHPLLEIACLLLAVASVASRPGTAGWAGAVFGWLLATLAVIDAGSFRLPDRLVLPLLGSGLAAGAGGLPPPLQDRLWGAGVGFVALTLLAAAYRRSRGREGLGAGDAKLLAAIGAWLGWQPLPWVVLAAAVLGLGATAARAVAEERVTATDRLPLGTLLAMAAWPAWLIGAVAGAGR